MGIIGSIQNMNALEQTLIELRRHETKQAALLDAIRMRRETLEAQAVIAARAEIDCEVLRHNAPKTAYKAICAIFIDCGYFPTPKALAFALGVSQTRASELLRELGRAGLVRRGENGLLYYLTGGER
jgi:DNA-binding MarR family transcriptional regulator